jgi:aminoglycoside phosphotransferase (APT) family kinase protein
VSDVSSDISTDPAVQAAQDEARELIQLKRTQRDPEQMRSVLADWLAPRVAPGGGLTISDITLPEGTGVANETFMFDAAWQRGASQVSQGFVARVATAEPLYIDADIKIHHDMYAALADTPGVPVPRVYGYEADPELLGAPFFVMERIAGKVPGDQPPWASAGFVFEASADDRRTMWNNAVDVLAALHSVDVSRFDFLRPADEHVSGLADHLGYWRRWLDDPSAGAPHDTVEAGYEWLLAHLPSDPPTALSWGDSRFANIMFDGTRVAAIFDWDTVSLSGPGADLGWWRFMDGPSSALPGIGTGDELVERWQERTGRVATDIEFYDVFTTFRLSAILMRLFGQMGRNGTIPPEVAEEQARNSGMIQALAAQLDALR